MVHIGLYPGPKGTRYPVDCTACGPNVQITGEGGFKTPEEAKEFAAAHRAAHVIQLQQEIEANSDAG